MPRLVRALRLLASISVGLVIVMAAPAGAQEIDQVAASLDNTGRFVGPTSTDAIDEAIDRANREGIAFAWLDTNRDAEPIAEDLMLALDDSRSRFTTVLVLTNDGVFASSFTTDPGAAGDAAFDDFRRGAVDDGLDTFVATLAGSGLVTTDSTSSPGATEDAGGSTASGTESSRFPTWIFLLLLAAAVFIGIRVLIGRRKTKAAEAKLLELDRTEVQEQLRDNADRVIDLGDKVIASGDAELIRMYEEASRTYTDVSTEVEGVTAIEEMNRLDNRMDHAEWQFEVIEAKLEGRTPPTAPAAEMGDARPGPTTPANQPTPPPPRGSTTGEGSIGTRGDRPVLGPDDSIFGGRRPSSRPRYRAPRRGGGGMGGLGSILGSIILGGGFGQPRTSRRTQQRRASTGSYTGGREGGFGDLGGGVLRRGGTGTRTSNPRPAPRTRRGGGGRFPRGGGGRF